MDLQTHQLRSALNTWIQLVLYEAGQLTVRMNVLRVQRSYIPQRRTDSTSMQFIYTEVRGERSPLQRLPQGHCDGAAH